MSSNLFVIDMGNIINAENITAFTTIILALITGIYAFWTYKMVKINQEEFEISNRPYVSVKTMDYIPTGNNKENLNIKVVIRNSGKLPAIITETKVFGYIKEDNKELKNNNKNSTLLNPDEFINQDIITIMNFLSPGIYYIDFIINYKTNSNTNRTYETSYKYKYDSSIPKKLFIMDTIIK